MPDPAPTPLPTFPALAFPPLPAHVSVALRRGAGGRVEVLDVLRRRYVAATPEEWVRQHVAAFLVAHRGVPPGLVAVERGVGGAVSRRFDLVVCGADGRARLLVECKAPSVALGEAVYAQAARYNRTLGAALVLVTNGLRHAVYRPGTADGDAAVFLPDVPPFAEMT